MRLRKNFRRHRSHTNRTPETQTQEKKQNIKIVPEQSRVGQLVRQVVGNPNFQYQLMMMLLTFAPEKVNMDRRIDTMTSTVNNIRNVSELINNTMQSLRAAAEAPKQIRRLLK
ncbi:hypothetical protein [Acetonema longum]|uniref:Uncharacterized protein n=1 Tax=Acetonema longum DSM 6540 TaxID=1009370 RepID=F7NNE6_9FIRM|nr:hypothetical protein [Acetonema longum]EGO62387.1 hypothetical protein ALO_18185 [Acetonema longum DSM 6540]